MLRKENNLVIIGYVVLAFFLCLTCSFYLADLFSKATGGMRFLVFYQDSDLAFYAFWAVLLFPIAFFVKRVSSASYSLLPSTLPSRSDTLLFFTILILWTVPNLIFPGTNGAFPSIEVLYVNVLPALVEEILFRGCLLLLFVHLLRKNRNGKIFALFLASLLFAFWHFSPIHFQFNFLKFAVHFLGGVSLGFLFLRTKWLLPCILIHYVGNLSHFYLPYVRTFF